MHATVARYNNVHRYARFFVTITVLLKMQMSLDLKLKEI